MDRNNRNKTNFVNTVSAKMPSSPDRDSKFYRKFKPELPLSNPTTTYNKHRKRLLDCQNILLIVLSCNFYRSCRSIFCQSGSFFLSHFLVQIQQLLYFHRRNLPFEFVRYQLLNGIYQSGHLLSSYCQMSFICELSLHSNHETGSELFSIKIYSRTRKKKSCHSLRSHRLVQDSEETVQIFLRGTMCRWSLRGNEIW